MRRFLLALTLTFAVTVAACTTTTGNTPADSGAPDPAASAPPPTAAVVTPSSVPSQPSTTTDEAFTRTTDLVYLTLDGVEFLLDVYEPAGEGPWPVVVSFHGLSNAGKDDVGTTAVAGAAATEGLLVFTPTWIVGDPFPITTATFDTWVDIVSCAVAFAQQNGGQYGGDPSATVVDGFSAGAGAALIVASLEPSDNPVPGCAVDSSPAPVSGFVLGDGEYFLHSGNFDTAFDADLDAMRTRLSSLIDPTRWSNPGARFFVWVADPGTSPRPVGDGSDETGWFAQRDGDGSIRADLEDLGELDDGIVSNIDAAALLEVRLSRAGFDVTLDKYPGGHTTLDKVPEIVGYLKTAASG